MSMTDPIADMLTRIRNANMAGHERVEIPSSKVKLEIARILSEEGFIRNYRLIEDGKTGDSKNLFEIRKHEKREGHHESQTDQQTGQTRLCEVR